MTGPNELTLREGELLWVMCETNTTILATDSNGEMKPIGFVKAGKTERLRVLEDTLIRIEPALADGHWSVDVVEVRQRPDPTPVEIPEDKQVPETLSDKMRRMVYEMAANMYGANQVETLEEAMDFDMDGDGFIGVREIPMEEEFPIETPSAEAETPPEPVAEPVAEETPKPEKV